MKKICLCGKKEHWWWIGVSLGLLVKDFVIIYFINCVQLGLLVKDFVNLIVFLVPIPANLFYWLKLQLKFGLFFVSITSIAATPFFL